MGISRDTHEGEPGPGEPTGAPGERRRRPRYAGTHPRRFEDKYKERDPENHPDVVARVLASGKTPVGSHRPICVAEILDVLAPQPGEVAVDATLGAAGHALALLPRLMPGGHLVGLDCDPREVPRAEARVRAKGFGPEAFTAVHANMAALPRVLADRGLVGADVVLADLGCSSMQLDDPSRGFSYKVDGPLDLRMNQDRGQPASTLLARLTESQLAALLVENADEPRAEVIARACVAARASEPVTRTIGLARVVRGSLSPGTDPHATLARVFQALRIAVNDELSALESFLRALPSCTRPGARVAVLTFHSGEDRRVKRAFRDGLRDGAYSSVARDVIRPGREEVGSNPRASAAKLRWAVRS